MFYRFTLAILTILLGTTILAAAECRGFSLEAEIAYAVAGEW